MILHLLTISDVNSSLNDLKSENEQLRSKNKELWQEIKSLNGKMDKLEGQFRRNNLRFSGIKGSKMITGMKQNRNSERL